MVVIHPSDTLREARMVVYTLLRVCLRLPLMYPGVYTPPSHVPGCVRRYPRYGTGCVRRYPCYGTRVVYTWVYLPSTRVVYTRCTSYYPGMYHAGCVPCWVYTSPTMVGVPCWVYTSPTMSPWVHPWYTPAAPRSCIY